MREKDKNLKKQGYMQESSGITLIALVVTIIILIILATISVNLILGDKGIINRSQKSKEEYEILQAKEKLTITLGDAQIEKRMNKEYNQNKFLDKFIVKQLPNTKIIDDIAIVDGYAFEIDRSVPKIGKYVGTIEDIVLPEVSLNVTNAADQKSAVITITAKEESNGITKIEIIKDEITIKEYLYDHVKEQVTEDYIVKRNGTYIVKVYGKYSTTSETEVSGLIETIKYSPDGSKEYKKEHQVKLTADETIEEIKSIKYQWLQTVEEPEETTFTESCENGATITKNAVTGKWYLWTLVETVSGSKSIGRSEGFNFDNAGAEAELTSVSISQTTFKLTAVAHDNEVGIAKYEFYVNDNLEETITTDQEIATYEVNVKEMGEYQCHVIVTDALGNTTRAECNEARTKMHIWEKWSVIATQRYKQTSSSSSRTYACNAYLRFIQYVYV